MPPLVADTPLGAGTPQSRQAPPTPQEQPPPWSSPPSEQTPPPHQSRHPPGADTPCSRHPPPPADGYCCGRYTFYWNAFLYQNMVGNIKNNLKVKMYSIVGKKSSVCFSILNGIPFKLMLCKYICNLCKNTDVIDVCLVFWL